MSFTSIAEPQLLRLQTERYSEIERERERERERMAVRMEKEIW